MNREGENDMTKLFASVLLASVLIVQRADAQTIPPDVISSLNAVPLRDTITIGPGKIYPGLTVFKVRNLTLTPGSTLQFSPNSLRKGMRYIFAVQNLYLQVPDPRETSAVITYQRTAPTKELKYCKAGTDGGRGGIPDANGQPGGPGGVGRDATARDPVKVYLIVNNLVLKGGNPTGARLLNLNFDGLDGDSGGDGCNGGKGGDGTDRSGFQGPGDSGKPGPGGVGGAAAPGQDGAILAMYLAPAISNDAAFFIASVEGGQPGRPGTGGVCGATGRAGSGGLSGGGGRGIGCDAPSEAPDGATAQPGQRGSITKTLGDYSFIFAATTRTSHRK